MPKRTNAFQTLVYRINQQLAGRCRVVESDFLLDRRTGRSKEVDIVIYSEVGPYPSIVSIECRDHKRPQGPDWISSMVETHKHLLTTRLVLVSSSGFTGQAIQAAKAYPNLDLMTLRNASTVCWPDYISKVASVEATLNLSLPLRCSVLLDGQVIPPQISMKDLSQLEVFGSNGSRMGSLQECLDAAIVRLKPQMESAFEEGVQKACQCEALFPPGTWCSWPGGLRIGVSGLKYRVDLVRRTISFTTQCLRLVTEPQRDGSRVWEVISAEDESGPVRTTFLITSRQPGEVLLTVRQEPKDGKWYRACTWDVGVPEGSPASTLGTGEMNHLDDSQLLDAPSDPADFKVEIGGVRVTRSLAIPPPTPGTNGP